MRKRVAHTIALICFGALLAGCSRKVDALTDFTITHNTTMVMKDETIQSAIFEEFEETYYDVAELESFIQEAVDEYTKVNGEETVKLENVTVSEEKKAYATFSYSNLDNYRNFEEKEVDVLDGENVPTDERIPETLISSKTAESVALSEAFGEKRSKVVIISATGENIRVEGEVLYFGNATLVDKNTVQSNEEGYTVVVFK